MKKILLFSSIALFTANLMALTPDNSEKSKNKAIKTIKKSKPTEELMGANPYTYAPLFFNAENGQTGRYWAGNKKYPGKAFIQDVEYTNIVVINSKQLEQKAKKKLRKSKDYLGFYIDAATNIQYNLYGTKKYSDTIDDAPDADVITMIAIQEDFGIGE